MRELTMIEANTVAAGYGCGNCCQVSPIADYNMRAEIAHKDGLRSAFMFSTLATTGAYSAGFALGPIAWIATMVAVVAYKVDYANSDIWP